MEEKEREKRIDESGRLVFSYFIMGFYNWFDSILFFKDLFKEKD